MVSSRICFWVFGVSRLDKINFILFVTNSFTHLFHLLNTYNAVIFKSNESGNLYMKQKIISLISGGIDSPVASYMMSKEYNIIYVYFDNYPFLSKRNITKVKKLVKKLNGKKLYIVPHGQNLKKFKKSASRYTCILCKRMMYRIANKIAKKEKAKYIITGESLAQVASQTLSNMRTLDSASKLPVLRPLIGFDKQEAIEIAKKISTYEISIQKLGSCEAVPQYPVTRSKIKEVGEIEKEINIEKLTDNAFKKIKTIVLNR